jgi:FixJ family two-component response regulator
MKAGAVEFLEKPVSPDSLITAVSAALELDRSNRQQRANIKNLQTRLSILSPREREVLPLVVTGFPNKHTAFILGITEVTLQIHRRQIMRKMAARSFAELVRMASQLNIPIAKMHARSENR